MEWYGKDNNRYTAVRILSGLAMNLTDATLVLLLPRNSRSPLDVVDYLAENLDT